MQINNPLFMKDWRIKDLILIIFTIQIFYFLLILLDNHGLHIPILISVLGFFIVLFIPGTLLLRLLNFDIKSHGQILLYTIGMSVFLLMLIGFLMNTLYPLIGFNKPLSSESIIITISIFILVLSIICYLVDKLRNQHVLKDSPNYVRKIDLSNLKLTASHLILILIPFLSILGAYSMNIYSQIF